MLRSRSSGRSRRDSSIHSNNSNNSSSTMRSDDDFGGGGGGGAPPSFSEVSKTDGRGDEGSSSPSPTTTTIATPVDGASQSHPLLLPFASSPPESLLAGIRASPSTSASRPTMESRAMPPSPMMSCVGWMEGNAESVISLSRRRDDDDGARRPAGQYAISR